MEVTGSVPTEHSGILSREALAFVTDLARGFDRQRIELLQRRQAARRSWTPARCPISLWPRSSRRGEGAARRFREARQGG
ncbi:MAG: hypothetical protein ACR2LP_04235 [Candidatus Limnocylindrales bacterium]